MKKLFLVSIGMLLSATICAQKANIYASEVGYSEEIGFSFRLNEDATAVSISIENDGTVVQTHDAGALTKGAHTIANPFGEQEFDAYSIKASAEAVTEVTKISTDENQFQFYAPRGIAIDKTPTSPYFGRIYTTNSGSDTDGYSEFTSKQTMGVFIITSDFVDITEQAENGYQGGMTWANGTGDYYDWAFARPTVAPNGEVFIASSAYPSTGLYILNPADPSENFVSVFEGTRKEEGLVSTADGDSIHHQIMHSIVVGTGEDRVLYTYNRINALGHSSIFQYNIGELSEAWKVAPSAVVYDDAIAEHMANGNGQIASDGRGGWWMSQYRAGQGNETNPALIHITDGVIDYNCGSKMPSSYQGGMAVTVDGNRVALGTTRGTVEVYDVVYDDANAPTLTPAHTISWGSGNNTGIDFDVAGNVYIVSNSNERMMVYSLPKADNSYTTRVPYKKGSTTDLDQATAEQVKVRKVVENGQVYIIKDNVKYNVLGTVVR